MKKFLFSIFIFSMLLQTSTFAYTEGFSYMVSAMGIELTNVNGLSLNEEIYNQYDLIVYGSPTKSNSVKQRFKECENGRWAKSDSAWYGTGIRGEYWILGEDYSGKLVHNEYFPDDYVSGISPKEWNYREVKGALDSWIDTSKYQYDIQRKYMQNQKLSRFGTTYDLTALDIGLDKTKVENYATWSSAGSIYTEKPGDGNIYWAATFRVEPMAGNAKLYSKLELPNGNVYTISKDQTHLAIPINFGAYVDGLSEYAKTEHVKILESALSINGNQISIVSKKEVIKINGTYYLLINKADYPKESKIEFELNCNSFMATYFNDDSILYDNKRLIVTVNIEREKEYKPVIIKDKNAPVIYSCTLKRVTTDSKNREKLIELYKSKKTNMQFICAGQLMKIEVVTSNSANDVSFDFSGKNSIRVFDKTTQNFEWYEPKSRGERTRYSSLSDYERLYDFPRYLELESETESTRTFSGYYLIPYETTQTLHSWNLLRENSQNAFSIDESKLFSRKETPYRIVIKAYGEGTFTKTFKFDVAERWDQLYNRDLSGYVK